jgi:hypothetical protein
MIEASKHNLVFLERGDIDYINYVADRLSEKTVLSASDLENYAEALRGIARAATDLGGL